MPTQTKERAEAREETMSSVSQRLVLVGVDESLQISQKPQSRKCQELAKMGNLDMCENHPRGRSLVENLSVNADERESILMEISIHLTLHFKTNMQIGGDPLKVTA